MQQCDYHSRGFALTQKTCNVLIYHLMVQIALIHSVLSLAFALTHKHNIN